MSRALLITNFMLFQIGWFACVLGGANQLALAGSLAAAVIIAIHLWRAETALPEILLLLAALAIGIIFESLLTLADISRYPSGIIFDGLAPYWMVMIWGLFATTINVSMRWIKALPLWSVALAGAILAPLSYLAGNRLGAVTFTETPTALLCIALGWAVLFPLLLSIAKRYNGYTTTGVASDKRSYANV